ncbi:MAG: hypothetical protein D6769_00695 [Methanobacteriota archaeon]|nr:MAG: hypothetical protein D6769_00695 [Euryarchaeota archaeon]
MATKVELQNLISQVSFVLGVLFVLLYSLVQSQLILLLLLILGIVVGLLNIQVDEVVRLLISIVAVIATSTYLEPILRSMTLPDVVLSPIFALFKALIIFMGPAALIIGLKTLLDIARD